ncbi:hypothetical protein DFH09DRAFT_1365946 [Mycena vulgaris]|nr:hypothetical protein DFH09DRAFT_1365946 [Mycena vulgaris]
MIAFVPLAVALLHTAAVVASPIVIGANPTVTVYVTADTCLPTGAISSVAAPVVSAVSSVAANVSPVVSSATGVVGGAVSSVLSVAAAVPTVISSVGGAAAYVASAASVAVPSLISGTDAALVSAVTATQATATVALTAANTLVNTILLISKGFAQNSIPASVVSNFNQSTADFASSLRALAVVVASGATQATSTYLASSVSSITSNLNTLTTQIQQLKSAGAAFNGQFFASLDAVSTALQAFGTSLTGNTNAGAVVFIAVRVSKPYPKLSKQQLKLGIHIYVPGLVNHQQIFRTHTITRANSMRNPPTLSRQSVGTTALLLILILVVFLYIRRCRLRAAKIRSVIDPAFVPGDLAPPQEAYMPAADKTR